MWLHGYILCDHVTSVSSTSPSSSFVCCCQVEDKLSSQRQEFEQHLDVMLRGVRSHELAAELQDNIKGLGFGDDPKKGAAVAVVVLGLACDQVEALVKGIRSAESEDVRKVLVQEALTLVALMDSLVARLASELGDVHGGNGDNAGDDDTTTAAAAHDSIEQLVDIVEKLQDEVSKLGKSATSATADGGDDDNAAGGGAVDSVTQLLSKLRGVVSELPGKLAVKDESAGSESSAAGVDGDELRSCILKAVDDKVQQQQNKVQQDQEMLMKVRPAGTRSTTMLLQQSYVWGCPCGLDLCMTSSRFGGSQGLLVTIAWIHTSWVLSCLPSRSQGSSVISAV